MASFLITEKDQRLTLPGYIINVLILVTCLSTLIYPLLDHHGILHFNCLFKSITGLPCPSCGYSTAVDCALHGDLYHSFLHNPGWPMWITFQLILVGVGLKSLISGRQALIGQPVLVAFIILILLTWTGKFLLGPVYF